VTQWRVQLQGDEFDLEDLPQLFSSRQLQVIRDGTDYYLLAEDFDAKEYAGDVLARAGEHLAVVNGIARLTRRSFRPAITGHVQKLEGNRPAHSYVFAGPIELRAKAGFAVVSADGGSPAESGTEADKHFTAAVTNGNVARTLRLWGRPPDWGNFYRVFEIIDSEVGVVSQGWASDNEVTRFKRTANHPEAAGDEARHGSSTVEPPPHPMTLNEARGFVEHLLRQWLQTK
jgi:hypothetical protein